MISLSQEIGKSQPILTCSKSNTQTVTALIPPKANTMSSVWKSSTLSLNKMTQISPIVIEMLRKIPQEGSKDRLECKTSRYHHRVL